MDLNTPVKLYEDQIDKIQEFLNILKPVELAVEAWGARDYILVISEGILKVLFVPFHDLFSRSLLAINFLEALKNRPSETHPKDLISLVMFLQSPENLKQTT